MTVTTTPSKSQFDSQEEKPTALPFRADSVPAELRECPQWVGWRYERRDGRNGQRKWTKVPVSLPGGRPAKTSTPSTWCDFTTAVGCYEAGEQKLDGIGFVFSADDPFAGVDLVDARDCHTGTLAPWAGKAVADLGSYAEVSPSGTGVNVFVRGRLPEGARRRGHVEVYDRGRFFTVTGHALGGLRRGRL
jgi:putative DNA primase/helicase